MISLSQAVVVEGRYDKIKLNSVVDGIIVTTEGFNIFRDTDKQKLIKRLAAECGIIVLTDSDDAGFKIRRFIADIAAGGEVYHAYIPELQGKERRKQRGGRAGLLGVEGVGSDIVAEAIERCLAAHCPKQQSLAGRRVTAADFYGDGLSGVSGASERRAALLRYAGLPTRLSTRAALDIMTRLYGYDGYRRLLDDIDG